MEDVEAEFGVVGAGEQLEIVLGVAAAFRGVRGLRVDGVVDVAGEPGGVAARELEAHGVDDAFVVGVGGLAEVEISDDDFLGACWGGGGDEGGGGCEAEHGGGGDLHFWAGAVCYD